MNNGYQKYNGCGADKEGGKIFNTFFYPELLSKHVCPLATNGCGYVQCRQTCTKLNTKQKLMDIEKLKYEAQNKALYIADVSGSALFNADCMDILPLIPDESVDIILTDPPYNSRYRDWETDRKSTRLNSSHRSLSRMPSSA